MPVPLHMKTVYKILIILPANPFYFWAYPDPNSYFYAYLHPTFVDLKTESGFIFLFTVAYNVGCTYIVHTMYRI